jgi:hypothetical protein
MNRLVITFIGVLLAAIVGQAAHADLAPPSVSFSHAEHMDRVKEPRCTDCHDVTRATSGLPAIRANVCLSCHDVIPRFTPRAREPAIAVPFAHVPHAKTVACASCHTSRPDARVPGNSPALRAQYVRPSSSESCLSCHLQSGKGPREAECNACHRRDERRVKPETHDPSWIDLHGKSTFLFAPNAHGESCTSCHREVGCKACHEVQQPRDHHGLWRVRTHGAAAGWDRDRCKTCHETNQCIACHTTTPPPSHQGAWVARHGLMARSKNDESCLTCHRQTSCNECHAGNR